MVAILAGCEMPTFTTSAPGLATMGWGARRTAGRGAEKVRFTVGAAAGKLVLLVPDGPAGFTLLRKPRCADVHIHGAGSNATGTTSDVVGEQNAFGCPAEGNASTAGYAFRGCSHCVQRL